MEPFVSIYTVTPCLHNQVRDGSMALLVIMALFGAVPVAPRHSELCSI
jgi:hypothetical protein